MSKQFILFFLALAIPSSIISYNAYEKLRWETFHQFQQTAQSLAVEINSALTNAISKEEARSDTDYTFLILEGDQPLNYLAIKIKQPLIGFQFKSHIYHH